MAELVQIRRLGRDDPGEHLDALAAVRRAALRAARLEPVGVILGYALYPDGKPCDMTVSWTAI